MIDVFNILDGSPLNQVFYTKGSTDWQVWQKPNNAKMVSILCIGGGGGGGSGQARAGSSTGRGGGSGGSSAVSIGLFSSNSIPDTLFLQVGPGGAGGGRAAAGSTGGAGSISYVSVEPNTTSANIFLQSGLAAAGGGGLGSVAGAAGIAGTAWNGSSILVELGFANRTIGQTGGTGSTAGTAPSITIGGRITTAGAPGAGYSSAVNTGGSITGIEFIPTITGGGGNINADGIDGSSGFTSFNPNINTPTRIPIFFTGGAGGGASNNNNGGAGGNASYGCGGGGGGCGVTSQAGAGGRGGDGLIIITCY